MQRFVQELGEPTPLSPIAGTVQAEDDPTDLSQA
jgi:hypothetical protein